MKIEKTEYYSKKISNLAKGCQLCVNGDKLVLFITGLCCRRCYYCPINEKKYQHDVIYANERPVNKINEVIEEARLNGAKGAGITGGDPLCKIDRTVQFIKSLKKKFGKKFHIHLYTSFDLIDDKKLDKLYVAGLDEIRFHADIDNEKLWFKIDLVRKFDWDIGIEIPAIPGKFLKTKRLIDYFHNKIDFLNLNELEIADNKQSKLIKMGFATKDKISYAVKDSEKLAEKLMKHVIKKRYNLNVHFCTAKLKDKIQLSERIKKRAKSVAKEYDIIQDNGILLRGMIYCKNLDKIRKELMKEFKIPACLIENDGKRLLTGAWIIDELKDELKKKKLKIAVVETYPTWDKMDVTVNYL